MTHLSSEQISEWMLSERAPDVERHLENCGKCREDLARLQQGLQAFRQSMRDWAEHPAPAALAVTPRRVSRPVSWAWAAVTAVAMSIVLLPLYLDVRQAEREAERANDSLLLNQVHTRLARTVPQSMEQLMELMNEGEGREGR